MLEYLDASAKQALELTGIICLSLGLPFERLHPYLVESHTSFIRLNYYPTHDPLANEPDSATKELGVMGVHHHSDAGILTLVLQDEVGGLEVYREGKWYPAVPVKDALFVNLADMLQVFTNDRYKGPLHRFWQAPIRNATASLPSTTLPMRAIVIPWKRLSMLKIPRDTQRSTGENSASAAPMETTQITETKCK